MKDDEPFFQRISYNISFDEIIVKMMIKKIISFDSLFYDIFSLNSNEYFMFILKYLVKLHFRKLRKIGKIKKKKARTKR